MTEYQQPLRSVKILPIREMTETISADRVISNVQKEFRTFAELVRCQPDPASLKATEMKKIALDAADIRILSALQQHGQLSKTRLSELVNLSPTPCWSRFNRLKKAGLIRGYHADIDLDPILDVIRVIVTVSLKEHRKQDFDRFESRVRQEDAIVECIATGGGMDYVLKVVVPNLAAFQQIMEDLLSEEVGISRYMTYIVTREIKSSSPNLTGLMADRDR